jgi:hypothetical protein
MQHGIFNEDHPDALPSWALGGDTSTLVLADALTVYGDYYARQLSGTAVGKLGRVHPVGAPLIELARRKRELEFRPNAGHPVVTFTSQGLAMPVIAFLRGFLAAYRSPLSLVVRLHPVYDRDATNYQAAFEGDKRVTVQRADEAPWTHEQLAISDLHISVFSACHYDSMGMGTPTAVLALPGHHIVSDLVSSGMAELVQSPVELAALVEARAFKAAPEAMSQSLYRPGFAANIRALLETLDASK